MEFKQFPFKKESVTVNQPLCHPPFPVRGHQWPTASTESSVQDISHKRNKQEVAVAKAAVTKRHVLVVTHTSEHHCFLFLILRAVPRELRNPP